jgi:hypothetical protein
MSVVFIYGRKCGSFGYQARAHTTNGQPRLTRFFSTGQHGGMEGALKKALWHEKRLKAQARRMRADQPSKPR